MANDLLTYPETKSQTASAFTGGSGVNIAFGAALTSSGGSLTKVGNGTLTLNNAETYSGNTTISVGTLALGSSGSINNSATIGIAAGGTFDVSAISSYSLSSSTTLSAAGTATAATIKGASGGTVNLDSRPITLTYDGSLQEPLPTGAAFLPCGQISIRRRAHLADRQVRSFF